MAQIRIYWTPTAIKQRDQVLHYWNKRNKSTSYSIKLNQKVKERISQLKDYPKLGKKSSYKNIRVISLQHYSIYYKLLNGKIIITSFWDNRQDSALLLKYLKSR